MADEKEILTTDDCRMKKCGSYESVDDQNLECPVCVSFFVEPLTLECGHSFCRSCLLQSTRLAPDGRCCPICRAIVSIRDPAAHPFNESLDGAVRAVVTPDAYAARSIVDKATIAKVLEMTAQLLPIFACYPGTAVGRPVGLHFFEPRYKLLIRRAWEGNRLFAYCGHQPRAGVDAVIVRIEEASFLRDGRANVVGVGVAAITLGECWVENDTHGLMYTRLPSGGPQTWLPAPPEQRAPTSDRVCTAQRCTCALM